MAKYTLVPFNEVESHPFGLSSELTITPESVFISYKLQGDLSALDLGDGHPHRQRVIKLWEKSCFELFVKNSKGSYIEFNFSPVFEWNAFYFSIKGDELKEYKRVDALKMDVLLSDQVFSLIVEIDKLKFPDGFFDKSADASLEIGITSVLKNKDGALSYWALNHKDTRPNFHDFRSYVPLL
jgi:hypothetical protein